MTAEIAAKAPGSASPAAHPLVARMASMLKAPLLEVDRFDTWAREPGRALAVFTEDPQQFRETLDLAVIVPELAQAFIGRFRAGVLLQPAARAIAPRFGFRRWPALVMLKDGQYVGAIDGLRDWQDYVDELRRLLDAEPSRPPSIGVAVKSSGHASDHCH